MKKLKNKEQRFPVRYFRQMDFLVKARFRMQFSHIETDDTPELREIVHITDSHTPSYLLIVSHGARQYLINSAGERCSDSYDSIRQLLGTTSCAHTFLVQSNRLYGVLNASGQVMIPCDYRTIELLPRLRLKGRSYDTRIDSEAVCFYICAKENGRYDLYAHDGSLVFHDTAEILPGEERIRHDYNFYTSERTQERKLETLHVYETAKINGADYYKRYVYRITENAEQDRLQLVYEGCDGDEEIPSEVPVPLLDPPIENPYPGLFLNTGYGLGLCLYLRLLLEDDAVFSFVDPEQIRPDQITYMKRIAHSLTSKVFIKKDAQGNLLYPQRCFTDVIERLKKLETLKNIDYAER